MIVISLYAGGKYDVGYAYALNFVRTPKQSHLFCVINSVIMEYHLASSICKQVAAAAAVACCIAVMCRMLACAAAVCGLSTALTAELII